MKTLIVLSSLFAASIFAQCPVTGDAKDERLAALDALKNRSGQVLPINPAVSLAAILEPGNDRNRFDQNSSAVITGYIAEVKAGGYESCNCHAKDSAHRDTHIAVVLDPKDYGSPRRYVIVEVTPRTRNASLATANLRKLIHQRVTITGDIFFDAEHVQNAENTNPGGKANWRATCVEIHPAIKIEAAQ